VRIAQLTSSCGGKPHVRLEYRGWRFFGETHRAAAVYAAWSLSCPKHGVYSQSEPEPTEEELAAPGGAGPEKVEHFAPKNSDENYNGADFAEPSDSNPGAMTLSYGELVPSTEISDFGPFVARAENMLPASVMALAQTETLLTASPTVLRRTWYSVGPPDLAVVELHFRLESRDTLVDSCSI
jgi:hypothetical protein